MSQIKYFGNVLASGEPRTCEAVLQGDGAWRTFNLDLGGKWVAVDPSLLRDTEEQASGDARRMAGLEVES